MSAVRLLPSTNSLPLGDAVREDRCLQCQISGLVVRVHRRSAERALQPRAIAEMISRLDGSTAHDRGIELEDVVELEVDGLGAPRPLDHDRYGRGVLASGS